MILFDMHRKSMNMKKGNPLGYIATENAYNNGKDWLEEVKIIIYENYLYLNTYFKKNLPDVIISPLQGTYLCWLDFSGIKTITDIKDFMINKCKVAVELGLYYGNDNSMFIRVNLATDISNIKTFAERVKENLLENCNVYE